MNERLKQLSDETNAWMDKIYSANWWKQQEFYQYIWQERYAELIIRDCATLIDTMEEAYGAPVPSTASKFIKKKFGLE